MPKHQPLFSVIVPIYNVEPYLRQCLDSICGQTYEHMEIILVDDGSPDHCGAICDEYQKKDARIRVIHKQNGGLVSARQAGTAVCTGDYVVNVDSDDYISYDLLAGFVSIIEKYGPDVIIFDCIKVTNAQQAVMKNTLPKGLYAGEAMRQIRDALILDSNNQVAVLYNIWGKVVRRDQYIKYQKAVPKDISRGEDLAVTGPLLAVCDSAYISDANGYYYRNNPKSIMNTFRMDEVLQMKRLAKFLSEHMGCTYQSRIDNYVLLHYYDFLDRAIRSGSYKKYREVIRETLDEDLLAQLQRAKCTSPSFKEKIVFFLMQHRWFTVLWLLRRIKNENV